ncbi:MAG TPA: hypothetical protein VMZ50_14155 [Phycisphaerae bacterium]|nr:hypothetical protein [Phycisphaerae bacterium]
MLATGDGAAPTWSALVHKQAGPGERAGMCIALREGEEVELRAIGRGNHQPYEVVFRDGHDAGVVSTRRAVFKTTHVHRENKRYRESMDPRFPGSEREVLCHDIDQLLGFDLVPPTVHREVARLGTGSVQAWVDAPTAWESYKSGDYDWREDTKNPWLHRLAALDFVTGQIDRHANNWMMDAERRVYATDNGYAFPDGDDRKWFKSSAGKALVGADIHPQVRAEVSAADPRDVEALLRAAGCGEGEVSGVTGRLRELRGLSAWKKLGAHW